MMAVINYTQDAVLMGYQQWLMQQGQIACLERIQRPQEPAPCSNVPGAIVAQAGSQIRYTVLTSQSSVPVFFSGTFQNELGMQQNVAETVVGTSAGGADHVIRPATAGCYRTFVASVGSALVAGSEVYVLAELGRTNNGVFQPYALLVSGYVRTNEPIDMSPSPGTKNPPTGGGGGGTCVCPTSYVIQGIDGIQSAQGWQVNRTPAANTVERIIQMNMTMFSDTGVGNRYLFVENVVVGAGPVFYQRTANDIPASTDMTFQCNAEIGAAFPEPDVRYGVLPSTLWYAQEYQMQVGIGNFLSGDEVIDAYAIIEVKA